MKIVSVSMVRNEADIVETFVRYHCGIVDAMEIVDHGSVDGTARILEQLRDEGLPLRLATETGGAQDQSRVVTAAARRAAREDGADLVVPLDADEFLVAPGSPRVREVVERLPAETDRYFQTRWVTYVPHAGDPASEPNVLRRIRHRRESESGDFCKVIVPGPLLRDSSATLKYGSHGVSRHGWIWHRRFERTPAEGLAVAHFPVRSVDQLIRKVLVGWPSNLARADRKDLQSHHWLALYERFRGGEVPVADELPALALAYYGGDAAASPAVGLVLDPVPLPDAGFEQRYGPAERVPLVTVMAAAMEQLARSLARSGGGRGD